MERESISSWCGILSGLGMLIVAGCEAPPSNEGSEDSEAGSALEPRTLIEPTPEMLARDYVPTPGGQWVHRSCVIEVENGGRAKTGRRCAYKPGPKKPLRIATVESAVSTPDPAISWAWYANSYKTTPASPGWYDGFYAIWTVPSNPVNDDGQTLHYFPGLENYTGARTTIIQPVLTYWAGSWLIASWWGPDSNGNYQHSTFMTVSPGDLIWGNAYGGDCTSDGVCDWYISTSNMSTGYATALTVNTGFTYDYAAPWVEEVYNITRCSNFPASSISASSALFVGPNNVGDSGSWLSTTYSSSSPNCSPSVSISGSATTISQTITP